MRTLLHDAQTASNGKDAAIEQADRARCEAEQKLQAFIVLNTQLQERHSEENLAQQKKHTDLLQKRLDQIEGTPDLTNAVVRSLANCNIDDQTSTVENPAQLEQMTSRRSDVVRLNTSLNSANDRIDGLEKLVSSASSAKDGFAKSYETGTQRHDKFNEENRRLINVETSLTRDKEDLQRKLSESETAKGIQGTELNGAKSRLAEAEALVISNRTAYDRQLANKVAELAATKADGEKASKDANSYNSTIVELKAKITQLETQQLTAVTSLETNLGGQLASIAANLQDERSHKAEMDKAKSEKDEAKREKDEARTKLTSALADLGKLKSEEDVLRDSKLDVDRQLHERQAELDEKAETLKRRMGELNAASTELSKLRPQLKLADKEIQTLKEQLRTAGFEDPALYKVVAEDSATTAKNNRLAQLSAAAPPALPTPRTPRLTQSFNSISQRSLPTDNSGHSTSFDSLLFDKATGDFVNRPSSGDSGKRRISFETNDTSFGDEDRPESGMDEEQDLVGHNKSRNAVDVKKKQFGHFDQEDGAQSQGSTYNSIEGDAPDATGRAASKTIPSGARGKKVSKRGQNLKGRKSIIPDSQEPLEQRPAATENDLMAPPLRVGSTSRTDTGTSRGKRTQQQSISKHRSEASVVGEAGSVRTRKRVASEALGEGLNPGLGKVPRLEDPEYTALIDGDEVATPELSKEVRMRISAQIQTLNQRVAVIGARPPQWRKGPRATSVNNSCTWSRVKGGNDSFSNGKEYACDRCIKDGVPCIVVEAKTTPSVRPRHQTVRSPINARVTDVAYWMDPLWVDEEEDD